MKESGWIILKWNFLDEENMPIKKILFQIGIEGHINVASAVQKEFQLPVIAVVESQKMHDYLLNSKEFQADKIYSFPEFYKKNKRKYFSLDISDVLTKVHIFENKWNIKSTSRYVNCDRYILQGWGYTSTLKKCLLYMAFAESIIENEDIAWSRGNIVTFFGMILQKCCIYKNIPSLKVRAACVNGRIEIMDETRNGSLRGWRRCYEEYIKNPGSIDPAIINNAKTWLNNFKEKPNRPRYSEINSVLNFSYKKFINEITSRIKVRLTSQYWYELFNYDIDKKMNKRPKFGSYIFEDFVNREFRAVILKQQKWYKEEKASLTGKFIYLPLQYSPEISTLMHGVMYEKQEIFVDHLSKIIPSNYKILVKEHTSMVGRRKLSFYKNLEKYFNVELVSPKINTFFINRKMFRCSNCYKHSRLGSVSIWKARNYGG